ncbi:MAG: PQQ-dependent sugar dehydrogenase [Gammaproteobacteria bacterium]
MLTDIASIHSSSFFKKITLALLLALVLPVNAALNTANAIIVDVEINSQPTEKPGPILQSDTNAAWRYSANNNGILTLHNVQVLKRQKAPAIGAWETVCSLGTIESGKAASCVASENIIEGGYKALVIVRGNTPANEIIESSISAFYLGSSFIRISVANNGSEGNRQSNASSISADGLSVVFRSAANNLVPDDTNDRVDVFVYDKITEQVSRVSVASDGSQALTSGDQNEFPLPAISANGRYVVFSSYAENLVPDDTNETRDVFLHDRVTQETTRVSIDSDGIEGNQESFHPSVSADGRFIEFGSSATNLVAGDFNAKSDIFVHDRNTGETTRVSVSSTGSEGNNHSSSATISGDGRYVGFSSRASNLVSGDTNNLQDSFIHDRNSGQTTRISVSSRGIEGNGRSYSPSISIDGRYAVFQSFAGNLVAGDTDGTSDIFVFDRVAGETRQASVFDDAAQMFSRSPSISADNQFIFFGTTFEIFAYNRINGETTLLTSSPGQFSGLSFSADGRFTAFATNFSGLVVDDLNISDDVFLYENQKTLPSGNRPELSIQAELNGQPTTKPGPSVSVGSNLTWTYTAANEGNAILQNVEVRVRRKLPSLGVWETACVIDQIAPGNSATCEVPDLAIAGIYKALVVSRATTVAGGTIESSSFAFYKGEQGSVPALSLNVEANSLSTEKPGPMLTANTTVHWAYSVTNSGSTVLNAVEVRGRRKLPSLGNWESLCTIASIQPGATGRCTSTDTIILGLYKTLLVARATTPSNVAVENSVIGFYTGEPGAAGQLSLSLTTTANGLATDKPGPAVQPGSTVNWRYSVTNTGNAALQNILITGRQKVPALGDWETLCSFTTIAVGATKNCSSSALAISGTYKALVVARSSLATGENVEDKADVFYQGTGSTTPQSSLSLQTLINNLGTAKPGPSVSNGSAVNWTYAVTNTGNTTLDTVNIRGRQKLPAQGNWEDLCTISRIQPGTTKNCTSTSAAISGTYKALILAQNISATGRAEATNIAFYTGGAGTTPQLSLTLQTQVNGQNSAKPGPTISTGSTVNWAYHVTNTGNRTLSSVTVRGRQKLPTLGNWEDLCSITLIQPGSTKSCTSTSSAISGSYKALILAQNISATGARTEATHLSFYTGGGTTTDPFGLTNRAPLATLSLPGEGLPLGDYTLEDKFPNLRFKDSLYLTAHPEDDRLVVVEQHGLIHAFPDDASTTQTRVVLDISNRIISRSEQGLLGLAFDPAFTQNHYLYVHYSLEIPRRSVIARFTWDPISDLIELSSEKVILEIPQPAQNHNGGMLAFGPDGFLYIALGDGSTGGDADNNAQNRAVLLGSLLRIDVHPENPNTAYDIPADNPFVGQVGVREEIYAYGFRNPFRFSFDRQTGDLWLGDVGESNTEEINRVESGGNYGWRVLEGTAVFNDSANTLPLTDFIPPLFSYDHSVGFAVIGGYVYRGNKTPSLLGRYIYADFVTGTVSALDYDGNTVTGNTALATARRPTSFGEDNAGELYVVSRTQGIYGLVEAAGTGGNIPDRLSETGIFTNMAALQVASGFIEYDINHPFHSDNAIKRRWVAVPDDKKVGFSPTQGWNFPQGTVVVKHFEMEMTEGNPDSRKRLETRLLLHTQQQGWQGFTYRWNSQGTDASLLSGRQTEQLTITTRNGNSRAQLYEYPSRTDCIACHTAAANFTLGLTTPQLNRDFNYNGVVDNQLRSWDNIDMFDSPIDDAASYASLPALDNDSASIESRARTYLDVNCAQCHQPNGTTPVDIDLRLGTSNANMNTIGVIPLASDLGISGALIIKAGSKSQSVLWQRMNRLDGNRMPPLSSHVIDQEAVNVIGQWIDAM